MTDIRKSQRKGADMNERLIEERYEWPMQAGGEHGF